jgi:hypothetical protein
MKNRGIIALLCILALVLGVFSYLLATEKLTNPLEFEREITKVETVSESDETEAIEEDLEETDVESGDEELLKIESELNSSY